MGMSRVIQPRITGRLHALHIELIGNLIQNRTVSEAAAAMNCSPGTARNYVQGLREFYHVSHVEAIIHKAWGRGHLKYHPHDFPMPPPMPFSDLELGSLLWIAEDGSVVGLARNRGTTFRSSSDALRRAAVRVHSKGKAQAVHKAWMYKIFPMKTVDRAALFERIGVAF